jgi:hypothetical protein
MRDERFALGWVVALKRFDDIDGQELAKLAIATRNITTSNRIAKELNPLAGGGLHRLFRRPKAISTECALKVFTASAKMF